MAKPESSLVYSISHSPPPYSVISYCAYAATTASVRYDIHASVCYDIQLRAFASSTAMSWPLTLRTNDMVILKVLEYLYMSSTPRKRSEFLPPPFAFLSPTP